jgi:hypothetical protein
VKGVLAMALQAATENRTGLLVRTANASEAAVVEGLSVYPIGSLAEAVGYLSGQVDIEPKSVDLDEVFRQLLHCGRLRRRQRSGLRQARHPDRGLRQSQYPDDRSTRNRQDLAGQASAHDPSPAHSARESRGCYQLQQKSGAALRSIRKLKAI